MKFMTTDLADVLHITPTRFGDDRGWFMESWRHNAFEDAVGREITFVQDNHSYSAQAHTVRGLHFQSPPFAQGKLVRCTRGAVIDIAVDFRKDSPNFGKWVSRKLSAENGEMLWVSEGYLHGFSTLEPHCEVQYKCTNYYNGAADGNIAWNDKTLAIDWGLSHGFDPQKAVLSDKDKAAPQFSAQESPF